MNIVIVMVGVAVYFNLQPNPVGFAPGTLNPDDGPDPGRLLILSSMGNYTDFDPGQKFAVGTDTV